MEALPWFGQKAYNAVPMANLTLATDFGADAQVAKGKQIGEFKSAANFTFVRLHAGGHMVPLDQPEASLDVVNRWVTGEWWV